MSVPAERARAGEAGAEAGRSGPKVSPWRTFRALVRHELRGRGTLIAAALALGCLPFALPLLPQARGQSAEDLRLIAAPILTGLGALLLALLLGAELLSRELAERRLGFYLARPIALGTLWAAKLTAAYGVLLAGTFCMIAPVALFDRPTRPIDLAPGLVALFACAALLLLLLAASALAIFARARSARLALDVTGLLLASVLAGSGIVRLFHAGALHSLLLGASLFGGASIASFYAAHAAALAQGRSDLRRASRILSTRLWSFLLPSAGAFALFAAWTLSPTPAALREIWAVDPSPRGDWVALTGRLAGRFDLETLFLWHPASPRFYRIPAALPHGYMTRAAFSRSGNAAAWVEREGTQWVVWRLDLDAALRGAAEPVRTTVSFVGMPSQLLLSPDGRLLASRSVSRWTLDDLATGKLLATVADADFDTDARWVANDRLRVFGVSGFDTATVHARAWELTSATVAPQPLFSIAATTAGEALWVSDLVGYALLRASPDGRRALLRDRRGWRLLDADSGALLADVAPFESSPGADRRALPVFLDDGRILTRRREANGLALGLLDREGRAATELHLALPGRILLGAQPSANLLLLVQLGSATEASRLVEVDLADGSLVERGRGVLPATGFSREIDARPSGDGARWLLDERYRLRYLRPDGMLVDPLVE